MASSPPPSASCPPPPCLVLAVPTVWCWLSPAALPGAGRAHCPVLAVPRRPARCWPCPLPCPVLAMAAACWGPASLCFVSLILNSIPVGFVLLLFLFFCIPTCWAPFTQFPEKQHRPCGLPSPAGWPAAALLAGEGAGTARVGPATKPISSFFLFLLFFSLKKKTARCGKPFGSYCVLLKSVLCVVSVHRLGNC